MVACLTSREIKSNEYSGQGGVVPCGGGGQFVTLRFEKMCFVLCMYYVCLFVCMYVCMCIYIYIYIYIKLSARNVER